MDKRAKFIQSLLDGYSLVFVRAVPEDEADRTRLPRALEQRVLKGLLLRTVVPLRHVRATVTAVGRRSRLNIRDASATFQPDINSKHVSEQKNKC